MIDDVPLSIFLEPLRDDAFRKAASERLAVPLSELNGYLDACIGEADYAFQRIRKYLFKGCSVLEVGAGLGLLSLFLASQGYCIVANNNDDGSFEKMGNLRGLVMEHYDNVPLPFLTGPIEEVPLRFKSGEMPLFDVVFSLNVIEHMRSVQEAFDAMKKLLKPSGVMWHSCPNYSFPYEPHLGIFLLPFFPEKTTCLMPGIKTRKFGVWGSLNFVTARDLLEAARQSDLTIDFQPKVFYRHLLRLFEDPLFRRRHVFLYPFVQCLRRVGVLGAFRWIPERFLTPVEFVISHRK